MIFERGARTWERERRNGIKIGIPRSESSLGTSQWGGSERYSFWNELISETVSFITGFQPAVCHRVSLRLQLTFALVT